MSAPSGNGGFCFPLTLKNVVSGNIIQDSRENKTHYFPQEKTLSV